MVGPTPLGAKQPFKYGWSRYRANGFAGTIPVGDLPGQKNPPPTGFTGGAAEHPSDNQIIKWSKTRGERNIALRLSEVDTSDKSLWGTGNLELPVVYAGNNVDGWALIGIDIDHYGDKKGYDEYCELAAEYGELPATAISTARWGTGSGTAIYLVPKGFRFLGKAAKSIDVIQKRHRFTVVYPSTNPDADNALYEWMYGEPKNLGDTWQGMHGDPAFEAFEHEVPNITDIAVFPEAWFAYLTHGGMAESDDPISELTLGGLQEWMVKRKCWGDGDAEVADEADACRRMRDAVGNAIGELEASPSSHDILQKHDWILLSLGAEGHRGLRWALSELHTAWYHAAIDRRGDAPETLNAEIGRSVYGALGKIQPKWQDYEPDDTCESGSDEGADAWADRLDALDAEARVADGDYGGLGPIVGKLHEYDAKPADEYEMNDRGNARHFIDLHGDDVKYVDSRKSWILWDGSRWHRDFEDKLIGLAYGRVEQRQRLFAARLPRGDDNAIRKAEAWRKWALKSGNAPVIANATKLAKGGYVGDKPVALSGNEFDSDPTLLGCANGILELTTDPDVRAPRKEDYVTYNTGVDYVPWRTLVNGEGDHFDGYELWTEYLDKFLPDKSLQKFIQKTLGHLLIGGNPEKVIVFLFGQHDTGKSTMLGAIAGALGDYYGTIDLKLFKQVDLNPGLIRAVPLRVTAMSEVDAGVMDAATIKRLTGNDRVTAEAKYSNEIFEGTPQFTTVIACNNPPSIKNADEALQERLLVLPFLHSLERGERKYERQKQIETHSGIAVLSWLVEGWKLYAVDGLKRTAWPNIVKKHNREFGSNLNATQMFIKAAIEKARDCEDGRYALERAKKRGKAKGRAIPGMVDYDILWTPRVSAVYELYLRWCNANGVQPVTNIELTKDMGLGTPGVRKVEGKAARCYIGARLRELEEKSSGWKVK